MEKKERVTLVKLKRKLIYSALLFALSFVLLLAVTLGWFQGALFNQISGLDFSYPGVNFSFFQSVDLNNDGAPDLDQGNNIIYASQDPTDVIISTIYPAQTTAYRVVIDASANSGTLNAVLKQLSPEDSQGIDVTKAMKIKYINPNTSQQVDTLLYNLLDGNRDITLFSNYTISGSGSFNFDYKIYMDPNAGNQYMDKDLVIGQIIFYLSQ